MTQVAQTEDLFTAEKVLNITNALLRVKDNEVERVRNAERETAKRIKEAALDDQRREMFARAEKSYQRGNFQLRCLHADEYRDLDAVLAEIRTRTFAAKLEYHDADGSFIVTALIKRHPDDFARKIEKEIVSAKDAWAFYNRVVEKFYSVNGFTCRVDY